MKLLDAIKKLLGIKVEPKQHVPALAKYGSVKCATCGLAKSAWDKYPCV